MNRFLSTSALLATAAASAVAQGPALVADIHPTGSSMPSAPVPYGNVSLFSADDGTHGRELWVTDGTAAGTRMVIDLAPGASPSLPTELVLGGDRVWFAAGSPATGRELVMTNGKASGTRFVELFPGAAGSNARELTPFAGGIVFVARAATAFGGRRLMRMERGMARPQLVTPLGPDTGASAEPTVIGNRVYVRRNEPSGRVSLLVTDGSPAGTSVLGTFDEVSHLSAYLDKIVFRADDGVHGVEPWISDATPGGTRMLGDVFPGGASSNPDSFCLHAPTGEVYFSADDGSNGRELWVTDGSAASLAREIYPGPNGSEPKRLVSDQLEAIYMAAASSVTGEEIYRYYPATGGLGVLSSIASGAAGASPLSLTWTGERLFFAANDGATTGHELYVFDRYTGSVLVDDLRPGSASSLPASMSLANGRLLFTADDGTHGRELFAHDVGAHVRPVGLASSARGLPLRLRSDAPFLGGRWDVRCDGGAAGDFAVLFLGLPVVPSPILGCWAHMDLGLPVTTVEFFATTGSTWESQYVLGANLPLMGLEFVAQAAVFTPGVAQVETTNALRLTFGN